MEKHIKTLLNRLSCASITIATLTLILLITKTPETCVSSKPSSNSITKFPKSSCDYTHRELVSIEKKNKRIWSTNDWIKKVKSLTELFHEIQDQWGLKFLNNHTKALCVSAGAGHEVMALNQLGVIDVTGVELVESPPLVSRADPHNLPFFDGVFDFGFTAHLTEALFPYRFVYELERTIRPGGVVVVVVEECDFDELGEIKRFFKKCDFVSARNVTLAGLKMTQIIMRNRVKTVSS
ncbi:hypothetical protein MKW94_023612 [Papaver nudicaule]|uniref:Methyltransferase type 11 domain-containing protein n=1 Tax=Papaver nudicaule TaxID=74823 RepID=A0AA41UWF9_PAPNU|nr:hypothetical protein [Papaver nudicaule]